MTVHEEVQEMMSTGEVSQLASREALVYMAGRWLDDQVGKRDRYAERKVESPQRRLKVRSEAQAKVAELSARIAAKSSHAWSDLLGQTFALPSGGRISWGAAVPAQHTERALMLEVNAAGNLETAALHRAAIRDIIAAGVNSLGELS